MASVEAATPEAQRWESSTPEAICRSCDGCFQPKRLRALTLTSRAVLRRSVWSLILMILRKVPGYYWPSFEALSSPTTVMD